MVQDTRLDRLNHDENLYLHLETRADLPDVLTMMDLYFLMILRNLDALWIWENEVHMSVAAPRLEVGDQISEGVVVSALRPAQEVNHAHWTLYSDRVQHRQKPLENDRLSHQEHHQVDCLQD